MAATKYQIFCRFYNEMANHVLTNQTDIEWVSAEEWYDLRKFYNANSSAYDSIMNRMIKGENRQINGITKLVYLKESELTDAEYEIYTKCKRHNEIANGLTKGTYVKELQFIRPEDVLYATDSKQKMELIKKAGRLNTLLNKTVADEGNASNPKYDMVFMYDGLKYTDEQCSNATSSTANSYTMALSPVPCFNPNNESGDSHEVPYVYYDGMKRIKLDPWFLYSTHASLRSAMTKASELVNIMGVSAVKIGKVVPLEQYIEIV